MRLSERASHLFSGWMLASSPALNALEHPVYDVWVLDCGGEIDHANEVTGSTDGGRNKDMKLPGLQKFLEKK